MKLTSTYIDKLLIISSYLYFIFPLIIFFFGWLKLIYAIFSSLTIIGSLILTLKNFNFKENKLSYNKVLFLFFSLLLIITWLFFSGIGGFGYQNWDFHGRNAIFGDLISHDWPINYDYSNEPTMNQLFGEHGTLIYYFLFWLPSALVGKLFGWKIANLALFFWALIGILLTICLISRYTKKSNLIFTLIFILWGGLDIVGIILMNNFNILGNGHSSFNLGIRGTIGSIIYNLINNNQLEWWSGLLLQFSSHSIQLFWVFNQSIPVWVITILLLNIDNRKNILFTYSLIFLFAPLPAIGLIPFVIYKIVFQNSEKNYPNIKHLIFDSLSIQNILGFFVLASISYLFFSSKLGSHPKNFIWENSSTDPVFFKRLILFAIIEFVILMLLVFRKENKFLWLFTFFSFILIPSYRYGIYNDFAMRVSIPAILISYILLINKIANRDLLNPKKLSEFIFSMFVILYLIVSSFSGIHEILRSRDEIVDAKGLPPIANNWNSFDFGNENEKMQNINNFITGDPMNTIFFSTIGKPIK